MEGKVVGFWCGRYAHACSGDAFDEVRYTLLLRWPTLHRVQSVARVPKPTQGVLNPRFADENACHQAAGHVFAPCMKRAMNLLQERLLCEFLASLPEDTRKKAGVGRREDGKTP